MFRRTDGVLEFFFDWLEFGNAFGNFALIFIVFNQLLYDGNGRVESFCWFVNSSMAD